MKLQFRLPDEDEDENESLGAPEETAEEPDLETLAPKALILAAGAAAAQVAWPLPLPFVLLFGVLGAGVGVAWLLRVGKAGFMAGVMLYALFDFFTPTSADVGFILRSVFVLVAAFGLAVGVGLLIQRAHAEE